MEVVEVGHCIHESQVFNRFVGVRVGNHSENVDQSNYRRSVALLVDTFLISLVQNIQDMNTMVKKGSDGLQCAYSLYTTPFYPQKDKARFKLQTSQIQRDAPFLEVLKIF